MSRKSNVGNKNECYGCAMCAVVCPHECIGIRQNKLGFLVPYIKNDGACTSCGLCTRVCNYKKLDTPQFEKPLYTFAGWSRNNEHRESCSSGGVCFEISKTFLRRGYNICAVKYNPKYHNAEHYIASDELALLASKGSKYLQSQTLNAFKEIDRKKKNVIIGTPCQIDMWRRYLKMIKKEDNFLLIDFFCHGVPSFKMWKKYLIDNHINIHDQRPIRFRTKKKGWLNSYAIVIDREYISFSKDGDAFYFMFLSNCCLNPACYSTCKYKLYNSSADIRLGDLWGNLYKEDKKGVSAILAFTQKGLDALNNCNITLVEHTPDQVTEGQMKRPISKPWYYNLCATAIKIPKFKLRNIRKIFVLSEILVYQLTKVAKIFKSK